MKTAVLSILLAATLIVPAAAQKKTSSTTTKTKSTTTTTTTPTAPKSLPLGSTIPAADEPLHGCKGESTSLNQSKTDKGLLVMFSCNTCPFVIKAQKRTDEAMKLAKTLGIGMVIFNSNEALRTDEDSEPAMVRYADQQGYTVPYVRDDMSAMADKFGATRTPEVYLFDSKGKLVYKGALEDNPADPHESLKLYLRDALNALAAGKPIAVAETKSIGCSIKRLN
jgi:hypothetical protein